MPAAWPTARRRIRTTLAIALHRRHEPPAGGPPMRRLFAPTLAGLVAGSLLAGCPDREVTRVDPLQDNVLDKEIPVNINRRLDILFVVDNSGSMAAEQANLTANFPQF